jgi:hypothetical protein
MKSIEVQIGGSQIDKHYSTWLDVWYELTHTVDRERGYNAMIGDVPELTTLTPNSTGIVQNGANPYTLFVPLQFWFCRNYGLALPLIALQYHEVRFNIEWEDINNLVVYTAGTGAAPQFNIAYGSCGILVDYQYLDSEERRRFAQVGHEYLIEQAQYDTRSLSVGQSQTFTLNFNHPCKEFIWAHTLGLFNGESSATFLGYTASNDANAWVDEVQAVADNLVNSMVSRSTAEPSDVANWVSEDIQDAIDPEIIITTVGATTFKIVLNKIGGSSLSALVNLRKNVLTGLDAKLATVNLSDKISYAEVDVTVDLTASTLTVDQARAVEHTLSVADISTPVELLTDNRVVGSDMDVTVVQPFNYGALLDGSGNIVQSGNLNFNGQDRFDIREGAYFNYVQPDAHHTRTPADGINVYSFGLHPEQHQPTGTANMSRIDTARVVYKVVDPVARPVALTGNYSIYTNTTVYLLVTNYNVLRIMSGMGGLAYSN